MNRTSAAIVFAIIASAAVSHAFAEDAAPTPAPAETPAPVASPAPPAAPAPAPVHFYLEVDQADIGYLSQALNYLPKYVADPLILRLNSQLQNQSLISSAAAKALEAKVEPKKKK
ncbi:MAG TPA: hypothetical protein VN815_18380 [Steroidobacteraceae bacterium]|nr:hypothetical protein [Steroidobacteraceae bacterium]